MIDGSIIFPFPHGLFLGISISLSAYPCYVSVYGKNVLDSEIMAKIAKNLTELIGHTPLMELAEYSCKYGLKRNIVAKLESFNPVGSVKDRVAFAMIEDAEQWGFETRSHDY